MRIKMQSLVFVLLLGIVLTCTATGAAEVSSTVIPVCFIQNNGQADEQALFFADAPGYTLYLTGDGQILSTADAGAVSITYPGAGIASVSGEDVLEGKANFFIGNDQDAWVTGVPMYSTVRYEGLYDGISLVYHGGKGVLKREFIVAPGADPAKIQMVYAGQEGLSLDESGAILIETAGGMLFETAPVCYQMVDERQVSVPCRYVLGDEGSVTFSIGEYDNSLPLVIDPVLDFSTYFGGFNNDMGADIGLDDLGYIYIVGSTKSTNLPLANAPTYQEDLNGSYDIFVTKILPDGSPPVYSTYIGGNSTDLAGGLAVNNVSGEVIFTGSTESKNYPNGPVPALLDVYGGNTDAVVTRLNADGDDIVWSRIVYGNNTDVGTSIALDNPVSDYVVFAGYTSSYNLTTGWGFPPSLSGATDGFIIEFDDAGNLLRGRYLGGENYDYAYGVFWEHASPYDIWVTGSTKSLVFPVSPISTPVFRRHNSGKYDAFITRLKWDDLTINRSTYLGGTENDYGTSIAVDLFGYPYITGYTESPVNPINLFPISPTPGVFQPNYGGGKYDAFISKMEPALNAINYSTYLGGNSEDRGYDIAVDNTSNVYVTGMTISDNFPMENAYQPAIGGLVSDAYLTIMNETGKGLVFSTYLGGTYYDEGRGIAITEDGLNITLTGFTESTNFPLENPYQGYLAGFDPVRYNDAFITKFMKVPPVVDFYGEPLSGCSPLTVNFTDNSSNTPFPVTGWFWEFGDGKNSTEQNPVHVYYRNGTTSKRFNVTLTATNQDGSASLTKTRYIRVCPSIEANFSTNKTIGCVGSNSTIRFFNDTVGNPDQLFWDFGDGTNATTTTQAFINHQYLSPELYTVSLTATFDCCNNTTVKTDLIDIRAVPVADFNATPTSGLFPLDVDFFDNSTGRPDNWTWLFGSQQGGSNEQNPEHTYATKGHYKVSLQACNFCGCDWKNESAFIKVGDPNLSFMAGTTMVLPNGTIIVPTNDTTPLKLYLQVAEDGLSGYDVFVFFGDTAAGNITPPVTFPAWADNQTVIGTLPGPAVTVRALDLPPSVINPGDTNILLATFDLTGLVPQVMWFNVTSNELDDDSGKPISTNSVPANLKIVRLLPFPGKSIPLDPNGDQLYWDVNGNTYIDFNDVATYFQNMQWIRDNQYLPFFDYNKNGFIDFNDVILLFQKV